MPTVPQVLLAHPGTQYSFQLARELYRRDYLRGFHTCFGVSNELIVTRCASVLAKVLKIERQWQNRIVREVPAAKIRCYPLLEIETWWQLRDHISTRHLLRVRNERFQSIIPDEAITSSELVIGFDTSSYILAGRAKARGKRFILDRSIGHPRFYEKVLGRLVDRFPEWEDAHESKSEGELSLEDEEHQLADLIVVPSRFVAATLVEYGVPAEKIRINSFGTDVTKFRPSPPVNQASRLIFLFVGALTARKGLPLLLEAWRQVSPDDAELWIVGGGNVPAQARQNAHQSVRWFGPVSRERLPAIFQQAHVFVCPSFYEGLAQVQIEAAACGLPIIATTGSGGEEVVEEGRTGYVIEAGNLDQLVESIMRFVERPALVCEMRERATRKSPSLSWSAYGDRWQKILQEYS